jgi:hypothetical protein
MTAVVRRLAPGVPFGENLKLSAKVMTSTPPEQIGRMLSGDEASQLILRLVDGRYRPEQSPPVGAPYKMATRLTPPIWRVLDFSSA